LGFSGSRMDKFIEQLFKNSPLAIMTLGSVIAFSAAAKSVPFFNSTITIQGTPWRITILILGVFVIFLGYILLGNVTTKKRPKIPSNRRKAIHGTWTGKIKQMVPAQPGTVPAQPQYEELNVTFDFAVDTREIKGSYKYLDSHNFSEEFDIDGEFFNDQFLSLNYSPKNQQSYAHGCFFLQLDPQGVSLIGKGCGYGAAQSRMIVTGEVDLRKVQAASILQK
jgi:hypothetical protein